MAKSAERRGLNGDLRIDGARQARREDILKVLSIRFVPLKAAPGKQQAFHLFVRREIYQTQIYQPFYKMRNR